MATMFRVTAIEVAAQGVRRFRLARFDKKAVTPFEPGAHVLVSLRDAASGIQGTRAYSLTSDPGDTSGYEITVAHADRSTGISHFLHTAVRIGRVLNVSEPINGFMRAVDAHSHLLIAGGIGITPIVSLARSLEGEGTPFDLYFSGRSEAAMPFLPELRAMKHGRCCTATTVEPAIGRIDLRAVLADAPTGTHVYVCGPAGMIHEVVKAAHELDWNPARVHVESFDGTPSLDDTAFAVVLASSGREIIVQPGQTILDALNAAGVQVDYDCRHGACGRCTQRVLQGEPEHKDALYVGMPAQSEWIRICVSRAKSPTLVLDL